jgi:predicted small lipoprotein YifL
MTLPIRRLISLLAAACSLTLAACGQSGPLYLPGNPSRIQVATPPTDSAGELPDEDDGDE